jgi:amino acid transporter
MKNVTALAVVAIGRLLLRRKKTSPRFVAKISPPFKAVALVVAVVVAVAVQWFPMAIALLYPAAVLAALLRRLTAAFLLTLGKQHPQQLTLEGVF